MKNIRFRLCAAPYNEKSVKTALNQAYARVTGDYVLLYKRGSVPDGFKEVTDKQIPFLQKSDLTWLREANMAIMEAFVHQHAQEAEESGKKFVQELRKELEAEREKLAGRNAE